MDTFFEQIVSIKRDGKKITAFFGIWFGALLICFLAFMYSGLLGPIFVLLVAGVLYGAYRLAGALNVEYEYIVTNGVMDVDKIVNKSSRKRLMSFDVANVSRLEKYNPSLVVNIDVKEVVFACNLDDDNAYLLVCEKEGGKPEYLVFSPNEKMQSAIVKFLPKYIANSAFK